MNCPDVIVQIPRASILATWGPLIAALVTAAAALIGVALTLRHSRATHKAELTEARRDRQRTVIADLISATRSLNRLESGVAPAFIAFTASDLFDWANTDSAKLTAELRKERASAVLYARVEVRDKDLQPRVEALVRAITALDGAPANSARVDPKRTRDERITATAELLALHEVIDLRTQELEDAAITALPVVINEE